ncbi:histidinol-phosphate transaminase [bacterium]|nr:histidinol-phosphate transaminase [bacterium]
MNYFRKCVREIEPYVPGLQLNDPEIIKLNTNENPYPPSEKVLSSLKNQINETLRLYPDPVSNELRDTIAKTYSLNRDNIIVGNGSDEMLSLIFRAFVEPGDSTLFFYPTYTLYTVLAQANSANIIQIQLDDLFNIPDQPFPKNCKLCCVPNPNVPSGNFIPHHVLKCLANTIDGILVIDEAYVDFAEDNCLNLLKENDNIIITRTFSKSFSLAGMRIGYSIASPHIIDGLMSIKDSYNLNRLSAVAAKAALDDIETIHLTIQKIKAVRSQTAHELKKLGFDVLPSQTNFIFTRHPRIHSKDLYEKLLARKILVRYFNQPRVNAYVRITIGTESEMETLIKTISQIMEKS